jgi:hypothetical protein
MRELPTTLDELLGAMPRTVDPPPELWPQIAAVLRRPRSGRFMNLAAGLAVAALVLLLARTALRDETQAPAGTDRNLRANDLGQLLAAGRGALSKCPRWHGGDLL